MPENTLELSDPDFDAQMQGLAHEATQAIEGRGAAARSQAEEQPKKNPASPVPAGSGAPGESVEDRGYIADLMRPLVLGMQAMGRASAEQAQLLGRLEKVAAENAAAQQQLPKVVADLQALLDQKNTVSRQMFDALHDELKDYKDNFLFETVSKPLIRDVITLYDDLTEIHRLMAAALLETPAVLQETPEGLGFVEKLGGIEIHIAHNVEFILEVMARMEVTQMDVGVGKLDKNRQRAVTVENAECAEEDLTVVRVYKRGFLWRDRIVRPEDVGIKKWKEGCIPPLPQTESDTEPGPESE